MSEIMQKSTICQKEKRLRKSKHPESFHADLRHTSAATMCYAHVCHFRITNSDNEVMFLTTRFYEIQFNYGVSARGKKSEPRAMDIYPYDTTLSHCWDQQNQIKTCYCSPRINHLLTGTPPAHGGKAKLTMSKLAAANFVIKCYLCYF